MSGQNSRLAIAGTALHPDVQRFVERMTAFSTLVKMRAPNAESAERAVFPGFELTSDIRSKVWEARRRLESADLSGAEGMLGSAEQHFVSKMFVFGRTVMPKKFDERTQTLLDIGCDRSTMSSIRSVIKEFSSYMGTRDCTLDKASKLCWEAWNMIEHARDQIEVEKAQAEERRQKDCIRAAKDIDAALENVFGEAFDSATTRAA